VRNPGGFLAQLTLFPSLIVIGLQPYRFAEKMFGQSLQQQAGEKTVEVALVCQNHGWFGQRAHRVPDYALSGTKSKSQIPNHEKVAPSRERKACCAWRNPSLNDGADFSFGMEIVRRLCCNPRLIT